MIRLPFAQGKNYAVLGLGKAGRAAVESLLASGARVIAWDDHATARAAVQQDFAAVQIIDPEQWHDLALSALVVSPGILLSHRAIVQALKKDVEVLGEVELLYRAQPEAGYVAITGTNGKSTTTSLIAHILREAGLPMEVGGNLGIPALALQPLGEEGIYVLELSSYQLDLVRTTRFQVAVLLNISPDHLDHHGGMAAYVAAKERIFERQQKGDIAIVGIDDAASVAIREKLEKEATRWVLPISARQDTVYGVDARAGTLHDRACDAVGDLHSIVSLQGEHNGQNAAAAYAACRACGYSHETVMAAMRSYPGLAHRMEWLGAVDGVQFVNDSKATNADAAEKSLKTYDAIYWIAGGVAKAGGIDALADYFPKIRHAYLIGAAAEDFAKTLEGHVSTTVSETLDKAFAAAAQASREDAHAKPTVLLAPACASFDQFANFEKRGEAFVALYNAWKKEKTHAATA